jgi:hypothetical protein
MKNSNFSIFVPVALAIILVCYLLPWVRTPASALSLGAYDLAEWASLHPIVRETTPYLWSSLALRLPLAVIGILIASYIAQTSHRALFGMAIVLLATITLFPPLEFFTIYRDDANYRQQFLIAVGTLIAGSIVLARRLAAIKRFSLSLIAATGAVSATIGLSQSLRLLQNFNLPVQISISGYATIVLLGVLAIRHITKQSS